MLADRPEVLARAKTQFKTTINDSVPGNPTRNAMRTAILSYGLSVCCSGPESSLVKLLPSGRSEGRLDRRRLRGRGE